MYSFSLYFLNTKGTGGGEASEKVYGKNEIKKKMELNVHQLFEAASSTWLIGVSLRVTVKIPFYMGKVPEGDFGTGI